MIIWKGLGFLVAVITFLLSLVMEVVTESITNNEMYYQENSLPLAIAILLSGIINGVLGKRLNKQKARTLIDKETGEEVILKNDHSLFFIPMEYWGIILCVGAVLILFFK